MLSHSYYVWLTDFVNENINSNESRPWETVEITETICLDVITFSVLSAETISNSDWMKTTIEVLPVLHLQDSNNPVLYLIYTSFTIKNRHS